MRARWVALALALAGCGDLDLGSGTLRCSIDHLCPDGYHCAGDDRCWKDGNDPAPGDMAMPIDAAMPSPSDLATRDLAGGADLTSPDLAQYIDLGGSPGQDMVALPDLATLPDLVVLDDLAKTVDAVTGASDFAVPKDLAPPVDAATGGDLAAGLPDAAALPADMKLQMFGLDQ